jgi:hypothetical protein
MRGTVRLLEGILEVGSHFVNLERRFLVPIVPLKISVVHRGCKDSSDLGRILRVSRNIGFSKPGK